MESFCANPVRQRRKIMSNTEVLLIKGLMSEMTDEDQTRCKECYGKIAVLLDEYGEPGYVALALIGCERAE